MLCEATPGFTKFRRSISDLAMQQMFMGKNPSIHIFDGNFPFLITCVGKAHTKVDFQIIQEYLLIMACVGLIALLNMYYISNITLEKTGLLASS